MKNFIRLATVAFLGGLFGSAAMAQVIPTVSITAPATVSTGAVYPVSVAAADTSGQLQTLNVTRNGVYWSSATAIIGDPTRFNLSVSGNDTAPMTPGTISFYAAVTSDSSSANTTKTITVVDGTAPSVPTGLTATSVTTTGFTLNWTASTDNVAVTGYEVQQDSTSLGTVTVLNKAVSGLTPGLTYAMTVRAKDAATNWSSWSVPLNVTTNKAAQAAVTITSAATGTYGITYTATATGGSGTGALVWALGTGSTASNAAINASTGVITADSSGTVVINVYRTGDINYNASAVTANKTVTFAKALITVTLTGTKVYDATTASTGASASITSGALAGSDTIGYAFAATSSANAGTYTGLTTATISNTSAPTTRTTSYTITYAGNYIVTKANQTALTITSSNAATYGTAYTATATGGAATGALVWSLGTGSTASGAAINSSTGAITTTGSGTVVINVYRAASTNYNVSATTANFRVTFAPRPITVTLAGSKTYDGTTASTGASASRTVGTLAGTDTIAFAYAATSSANAGTYPGLATTTISNTVAPLTRTGSYAITNAGTYTINKAAQAAVTITSPATGTYGTTYTATASGGSGTGALVWALGTGSTATGAAINASTGLITANSSGTVVINVSRAADTNYNVSATTANFTVTFAKVAITVTLSGTKAYNGTTASTGASATITSGALVAGDTIGYAFAVTSSANAGTYSGLTTATISNTVAPTTRTTSYTITYAGSYTITKINQAAVTISSAATGTYGTAYTATATGGTGTGALVWTLAAGSTASGAAINSATGAVTATSFGTVLFNVYRAADTNYNASATTANFTVTFAKRLITVTLSGSKPFDGTTASTGASAAITTGTLGATDTIGYVFAATSSAAPGTYSALATTTISNVTAPTTRSGSYTITYAGSFTIAKAAQAAVSITSATSGTYGTTYTATASGGSGTGALVWALGTGSTASGAAVNSSTGVITATSSGIVVIKVSRAADANYNVSATTADFPVTIAQRPITVTLSGSKTYNGTTASTGASAALTAGTLAGTDTVAYAYAAAGSANAGSYPGLATATISNVSAPTARSGSYAITYAGSYTINPAATTFSLSSTTFFYNGSAQGPTVMPSPAGATFTTGGVLSATATGSYIGTATANGNYSGTNNNLTWSIAADTTPPTTPTGLVASNLTTTSFTLTWTASTDNIGVTVYTIYKNGVLAGTSSTPTFNLTGLTAGTSYNMTVQAQDAVPNVSAASGILVVTTVADGSTVPTSGLRLWLRGDLGTTLDGSGNVSTWVDQSAAHNNATQGAGARPLLVTNAMNGQPVLRFDGASDSFALPDVMNGATQGEIFIVAKLKDFTNAANGLVHFGGNTGTIYAATQIWNDFGGSDAQPIALANPSVLTSPHLFDASMASDRTGVVQINGVVISSKPNVGTYFRPNPVLGIDWQNEFFKGDVAEVIVFDHVLTPAERTAVGNYLYVKYAVGTPAVPAITSPLTASGMANTLLSPNYTIMATNFPTSYSATGLPPGLFIDPATGVISGTPTTIGTSSVTISATNLAGTGSATLVFTTTTPAAPVITSPLTFSGTSGVGLAPTYIITSSNSPVSFGATGLPQGLSVNLTTGEISGTPAIGTVGTFNVTISATNALGTGTATLVMTISSPTVPTTGLRLWLRGDLGTTLDGNGNVSTWVDQSAAHNNATQGGTTNRPLLVTNAMNGQPVLRFDGAGDSFALPDVMNGATQGEIFIVAKLKDFTNAANGLVHFGGNTGTIYAATQIWNDFGGSDAQPIALANPSVLTSPHLFDASMASDRTGVVQINGVVISSKPNVGTYFRPNPVLGIDWQNEFFKGDVAEVIVFDHVLTTTDHAMVNSYLLSKYALGVPLITSATTLDTTVNVALSPTYTITATGTPTSYNATGLPPGLSVNTTTGVISGTPTVLGSTTATISATNAYGTASASLLITVSPLTPSISSPLTLVGTVGTPLSPTYTISATRSPTSYNAVGLPLGLSVNISTGVISGTPASVGVSNVTISATNAYGTGSATLFITINPPAPVITSALTAAGVVNTVLSPSYTITATNSPTSYNATGLPPGLTLDPAAGVISGTPTATGVYNVTISATNGGTPGTATLVITIAGIATTFDLSATTFVYTGAAQGPSVVTNPVGATYSTGGTLSATAVGNYTGTATANGIYSGTNSSLNWSIVGDTVPPTTPTGLVASNLSSAGFTLIWTASTDNLGVTGYTIYRDGASIGTSTTTSFNVSGLAPFTSYNLTVTAQDGSGNSSAASAILAVTTLVDSSTVPTTGMLLWLRADAGITVDGSGGVQNWIDQSFRGNNATQSTAGNRPQLIAGATHGQPVLRFDGIDDYLNVPAFNTGAQQGELFVVVKLPNFATRDDGLWSLGASTGTSTELSGAPRILTDDWGRNTRTQIGAPVTPMTDYVIYNVSAVSGDWAIRLNGLMQFHTTTNTLAFGGAGTLGTGTGKFLQGDIAEVIAYDHNMATAERELVADYLAMKYAPPGITVPAQPTVSAVISPTAATLTWNAPAGGQHTTVTIERQVGSGGWVVIAQVDDVTTYTDSGLTPGQAYSYRIKMRNYAGVSAYSAVTSNDTDGDGVPDAIELLMGRNPNAGVIMDTGNQLQLVIITPTDLP